MLGKEPLQLAKKVSKVDQQKLRDTFNGMMKAMFKQKGAALDINILASEEAQSFINTHAGVLDSAFQQVEMSDGMRQRLHRSDYIFSGIKAFHEMNEAFPSLLDENGNRKTFEQFLNDVRKIDKTYNEHYLQAEYNFAHNSAEMAAKWEQYAEDGDRYNLQYRTAGDDRVRPEHAALDGVTLPMSDPFWEEYFPPNGWNCRCSVTQVRKSKYPETPHDEAMACGEIALQKDKKGIFHFNPGKQQKTFPDYNPYTIKRCRDCDVAQGKAKLARVPENELCEGCKIVRLLVTHQKKQILSSEEISKLRTTAAEWAKNNLDEVHIKIKDNKEIIERRTYVEVGKHKIAVGKSFFKETIAKNKRNPLLLELFEAYKDFKQWMPNVKYQGSEDGKHHDCKFLIFTVDYKGKVIELKCKDLQCAIAYNMRFK